MEIWGEAVGGKYGTVWRRLVGYLEVLAEEVPAAEEAWAAAAETPAAAAEVAQANEAASLEAQGAEPAAADAMSGR